MPDKKPACIIRPHKAGLFSLINNVATCAELYERVHVGWHGDDPNLIYKGDPRQNLWHYLFTNAPSCEQFHADFTTADEITNYPDQHLTYKHVARHYTNPQDPWRTVYNKHWRSWSVQPAWVNKVIQCLRSMSVPIVAVQTRVDAHAGEQTSNRAQTLDDYADVLHVAIREVKEASGLEPRVMAVCSDWESAGFFQRNFNAWVYPDTNRAHKRHSADVHLTAPQTFADAAHCLVEVMAMSAAHALVHPVSNMATGALIMSPEMRSYYIP